MTPEAAARELERRAREFEQGARTLVDRTANDALAAAIRWSSGTASPADLRREDHPYARRHGAPRRNPRRVSRQSGAFVARWARSPVRETDGGFSASVTNDDPKTGFFVHGTRLMFARRPDEAAEEEVRPRFERGLARLVARVTR